MNRTKVFRWIILLTSVSLVAALITQLLWVRDALKLKEDQFNSKVEIVLQSVVNQLMTGENFPPANFADFDYNFYKEHEQILNVVDPHTLDSLIKQEFSGMRIDKKYAYGVYRQNDSKFVMGDIGDFESELIQSEHWVSLTCLCDDESYLLAAYFPDQSFKILSDMIILPIMSGLFLMVLVFSFFFTIYFLIQQKKLSEMKTDFVNNMTHEFKTPIATISVSSEMLTKEQVINSPEKIRKYAKVIFDENTRLKNQVEQVLQIAILDKEDYKLKMREMDARELLNESIDNFKMQIAERSGILKTQLNADNHQIIVDKFHFQNVINNLLDNANKYSINAPEILIISEISNHHLLIHVEDKGMGISRENQAIVFKKFQRLQTGNIHDIKGFGLGLFYAKTIIEKMGGNIKVQSELNKGSRFTISFPLDKD
ncbi:MAG: HAMP domain-containing histidine kinase [Bacteroidales bacterium]|nr:HAMP domain-containing histidine kinase [Bacteroidales bacterium]MCF8403222.1 HAMP domain-containing histidine kinase [Bacteroidales bacterium]